MGGYDSGYIYTCIPLGLSIEHTINHRQMQAGLICTGKKIAEIQFHDFHPTLPGHVAFLVPIFFVPIFDSIFLCLTLTK